jgi:hypothetical protein
VVVFGDADFASIGFVGNGANLYLVVAVANRAPEEALIAIPPRDADLVSVTLSRSDMGQIWLVVVVVLPLAPSSWGSRSGQPPADGEDLESCRPRSSSSSRCSSSGCSRSSTSSSGISRRLPRSREARRNLVDFDAAEVTGLAIERADLLHARGHEERGEKVDAVR